MHRAKLALLSEDACSTFSAMKADIPTKDISALAETRKGPKAVFRIHDIQCVREVRKASGRSSNSMMGYS
ncbi:unnamed protein product, partial [Brenthis ino]